MAQNTKQSSSPLFSATVALLTLILLLDSADWTLALDTHDCGRALGLESGRIRDEQLSASSSFDPLSTGPANARLSTETGSGAWCPRTQINASSHEWIQVELGHHSLVTGVRTQGRWDKGRGLEFPAAYMVEYWRESLGKWARYRDAEGNEILRGNSDTQSAVLRLFDGAIVAKLVRLIPVSESVRTVCLRFELYGCPYKDPLLSYSAPAGTFADALDLRDQSYDGTAEPREAANGTDAGRGAMDWLRGGLGRLWDGALGDDNFEESPRGWVGWRADHQIGPFVSLELFFAQRQNLSAVLLHTSNFRRRGAHLFRAVRVHFASYGSEFSARVVNFDVPPDLRFESARWVRVPIPHRVASRVRLELHFGAGAEWLLVSEMRIESGDSKLPQHQQMDEFATANGSTTFSYFAVEESANQQREGSLLGMASGCLLIVALCVVACLCSALFCACLFLVLRRPPSAPLKCRPAPAKLYSPPCSSSSESSASPYAQNNKSLLFQMLLKSARRKMDKKIPCSGSSSFHQSDSLLKPLSAHMDDGDEKELMDIAKLVIRHHTTAVARGGPDGSGDESDEYADPDAPQQALAGLSNARQVPFSPRPSQLMHHYASRDLLLSRMAPSSDYSLARMDSPSATESGSTGRYRATPTQAQFFPPQFPCPPPLPAGPPPQRRQNGRE